MKKILLALSILSLCIGSASAADFTDFLAAIRGKSDVTYYRNNDAVVGSDGSAIQIKGRNIYTNYGEVYRINGDTIYASNNIIYQLRGSSLWGSNGTVYTREGNTIIGSNGIVCYTETSLEKREVMTFCKSNRSPSRPPSQHNSRPHYR